MAVCLISVYFMSTCSRRLFMRSTRLQTRKQDSSLWSTAWTAVSRRIWCKFSTRLRFSSARAKTRPTSQLLPQTRTCKFANVAAAAFISFVCAPLFSLETALQTNLRGAAGNTKYEISGHDYLKNIVTMPFYLQPSALQQLRQRLCAKMHTDDYNLLERRRSATLRGSRMSLREGAGGGNLSAAAAAAAAGTTENLVSSLM